MQTGQTLAGLSAAGLPSALQGPGCDSRSWGSLSLFKYLRTHACADQGMCWLQTHKQVQPLVVGSAILAPGFASPQGISNYLKKGQEPLKMLLILIHTN